MISDKQSGFGFLSSQAQDYDNCQQKAILARLRLD
jgi:hypothetical protein